MRKFLFLALAVTVVAPTFANAGPVFSVGFSPSHGHSALDVVLSAIGDAKNSVDIAAYSFTSKPIAAALVAAKNRGVAVRVVADPKANVKYTAVTFLSNEGVPVRINGQYTDGYMHNKFIVVDGDTVQTGSFNYSASAVSRNAENAPELAKAYQREFNRLWNESAVLTNRY